MTLRLIETITLILGIFFVGYYLMKTSYKQTIKHINKHILLWN